MLLLLSVSSQPESCWTHSYTDDYDANSSCGLAVVHDSCPKVEATQASMAQVSVKTVSPIITIGYFDQGECFVFGWTDMASTSTAATQIVAAGTAEAAVPTSDLDWDFGGSI